MSQECDCFIFILFQSKKHRRQRSHRRADDHLVQIDLANFIQGSDDQIDYTESSQEKSDSNENNEITKLIDKFLEKNNAILQNVGDIKELENSAADVDKANRIFRSQDQIKKERVDNNYFNKLKMRHAPERRIRMKIPFSAFKDKSNSKKDRNKRLFGFNMNKKQDCKLTTKTSPSISITSCDSMKNTSSGPYSSNANFITQKAKKTPKNILYKLKRSYVERICPSCGRKFLISNFNNNVENEHVGSQSLD